MSSFTAEKQSRPQFRNLNFPLLLTYRLPLPGLVSIMHRISGAALFLALPLLLWMFDLSLTSELSFERLRAIASNFFFKLLLEYPSREELSRIADLTTAAPPGALREVLDGAAILEMRQWVREVPLAETVKDYAVRLILATHPRPQAGENSTELARRFVLYGSSPRGLQSLILAAKARALLSGRPNVSFEDIRSMIMPSLRHRVILNLEADAEGISSESILAEVVRQVPEVP